MSLSEKFESTINKWFADFKLPGRLAGLYAPIAYALESGGKRIRPTLVLAGTHAFGGEIESVRSQCIGIEMFHNFTLLHDDVMDNSDVRRGKPTVHCKWDDNTAILSGDTMLTLATRYVAECPADKLRAILDTFNKTAIEVYEGQQLDMEFENRDDVTIEEYMEMIRLKTSVLLGCSLKIGAIMAGASQEEMDLLYDYGISIGLGFQLRDDYLDTFGNTSEFGKRIGNDILNDKKTWLMITAMNEDTSGILRKVSEKNVSDDEKISAVTRLYKRLGLDKRILSLIQDYAHEAESIVRQMNIDDETKQYLINLAERLSFRNI